MGGALTERQFMQEAGRILADMPALSAKGQKE